MRITQSMMTRNYLKGLNNSMSNMAKSTQKINSGKKFSRISENVSAGAKELRVTDQLRETEQYKSTIQNASNELNSAESNIRSVVEVLGQVEEKTLKAMNSATLSADDRLTISREINNLKDQILKTVNAQFGDNYLFSGTNNASAPFTIDTNGDVLYNGSRVDGIVKNADGTYSDENGVPVPLNDKRYLDIGLGMTLKGDKEVDPTTAFDISFSGLEILGFGMADNGMPKNVVSMLTELSSRIYPEGNGGTFSGDELGEGLSTLKEQRNFALLSVTELGTRTNFLENTLTRLEEDELNLKATRSSLIETNPADEITQQKMFEFSWNAMLKMGSRIIPPSLMDFIN